MTTVFSPAPKPEPKRKSKVAEERRKYGPKERREWVKSLPCAACKVEGYSQNAHAKTGGTGKKSSYENIVPLCGPHPKDAQGNLTEGCHRWQHRDPEQFHLRYGLDMETEAAKVEAKWLEFRCR